MTQARRPASTATDLSEVVLAAQHGDEDAFRALYRAVQPGLLRYLRALVGEEAEDVASEAWLQIARDLHSFRGAGGFPAWAARIARNRALDHIRHARRRPAVPTPVEDLAELAGVDDTSARAAEWMGTDAATALIATLPRDQAEAVLLRVVVGLDAASAAKVLGKRPGAVHTATYRGLRRLAERLRQQGDARVPAPRVTDSRPAAPKGVR